MDLEASNGATSALRTDLGHVLGDAYVVERELSGGGMSRVFVANDRTLKRRVVVKVVSAERTEGGGVERFRREILFAAQLQHPHIVPLLTAGAVQERPYFLMPFVEGESLEQLLKRTGALPVRDCIRLLREIASALSHAHERGVVHRDIKPANILLSDGSAMVTDFGVAKALSVTSRMRAIDETDGGLTGTGMALGTPAYIAPEQAAADSEVDHRADIYSFGALAYEMLTGEPPFGRRVAQKLIVAHLTEQPVPVAERRTGLPPALTSLVMRCLEKDPAHRPQSTREIMRDLDLLIVANPSGGTRVRESTMASIAVLPFVNLSPDPENEFFSDGITEEILNTLYDVPGVRVPARTSSFAFKGRQVDIAEVGRQLRVDSVLEGSVRKAGNRIRITAKLVNTADGYQLWSERYDRDLEDVFAIQDEIARAIVERLKVTLNESRKAALASRHPVNVDAYELYLRGRHCWNQRGMLQKAMRYFERALEKDPAYALAHHGLADAYGVLGLYAFAPSSAVMPKALAFAERAVALGDTLAETHTTLGFIQTLAWDWKGAAASLQRAKQLNPEYAIAHSFSAWLSTTLGERDNAVASARRALELEPLSPVTSGILALVLYHARDYDGAIQQAERVLDMEPNSFLALMAGSLSHSAKGQHEQAIAQAERGVSLSPEALFLRALLGTAYASSDENGGAAAILQDLERRAASEYVAPVLLSWIYAHVGEIDKAFAALERAYEERACTLGLGMRFPLYDTISSDPRFAALLVRLGLDQTSSSPFSRT
jgi:serine/threonine protein kinase/tetratricopeptide (TPR) repeat protein